MITIESKRHPGKFYFAIGFTFLLLCTMGIMLANRFIDLYERQTLQTKTYFLPIASLGVFFFAFYTVYKYYDNAPTVLLDPATIILKGITREESYFMKDIADIQLTGKMPFPYLVNFPMEGLGIEFKDGTIRYLYDDMYSNAWQIKSYLYNVVVEKKQPVAGLQMNTATEDIGEAFQAYKGNQWTSLRGISLWGLLLLFLFPLLHGGKVSTIGFQLFLLLFGAGWFYFNSYLMHYFGLTREHLVIRNHNLPWVKRIYRLSDVKEVVFETQGKMPNCLRVITNTFQSKLYPAGTLRDKHWLEMKDDLEKHGIKVRNECI